MPVWKCPKCKSQSDSRFTRCSYCSAPKPPPEKISDAVDDSDVKLVASLHNAINKIAPRDRKRLWAWMEDNIL